jgi:hypothetical protein
MTKMARAVVGNDGAGPFASFYCERCGREYRSQVLVKATIAKEVGRGLFGNLLRDIPIVGSVLANEVQTNDPRYQRTLTPEQMGQAWEEVSTNFHECAHCGLMVCNSDWNEASGTCTLCSSLSALPGQTAAAPEPSAAAPAFCSHCGAKLSNAPTFCPSCGTKI